MRNRVLRIALRVVLVLSLLANAVVIGVILRAVELRDRAGLQDTRFPPELGRAFMEVIEDEDEIWTQLAQLGDARRAMMAAAEARPLDREALIDAMAEVRRQSAALQVEGQRIMLEVIEDAAQAE
ncbi:hypothetical protein SLH49_16040 [Cognatiyoonia sp. IB215446]|uniref:hypothetical protein n=1 Tax=Cognatiyoonia sp. IB215446 TaxID=3097355 RepID=UPI002A13EED9|nr:hypothetical protein [Cognatiyoonia sp. IB215446]MDX8349494.1 hypothetical protein [Cognatiyoonia sp. IB215446]